MRNKPGYRRRRPRPDHVSTNRIRVELDDVEPPVWREIEVASDLTLDRLHTVLQVAMGWQNSHLHVFHLAGAYSPQFGELFTMDDDDDLDPDDDGGRIPETDVALDEVMQEVGDVLGYEYDFGDGWGHTLTLVEVRPRADGEQAAACTDGGGACPLEDSGGPSGYEELRDVASRAAAGERLTGWGAERYKWAFGDASPGPALASMDEFDPVAANARLAPLAADGWVLPVDGDLSQHLPVPVRDLVGRADFPESAELVSLSAAARLDVPVDLGALDAATIVAPVAWLLDYVGADGLALTQAGYLRPADVEPVGRGVGIDHDAWPFPMKRESDVRPLHAFRRSVQAMGLLRVAKGRLTVRSAGHRLAGDPAGLLAYVVARLPAERGSAEFDASMLVLLVMAAEAGLGGGLYGQDGPDLAPLMASLGWQGRAGQALSHHDVLWLAFGVRTTMDRLGATRRTRRDRGSELTPVGIELARGALQIWE